jgi:CysZ protein
VFQVAVKSIEQLFSAKFRFVLLKSLGLTIAVFVVLWLSLQAALVQFLTLSYGWMETVIAILAGLGLFAGMFLLLLPITSLVAAFFIDEIAEAVEERYYSDDPKGWEMPLIQGLVIAAKFTLSIVGINILVLLVALIPGVNLVAFYGGNGYLLGREYFELCGLRHLPHTQVIALRKANRTRVWLSGVLIAIVATIPFVNLFAPLFATALMVHTFKAVSRDKHPMITINPQSSER